MGPNAPILPPVAPSGPNCIHARSDRCRNYLTAAAFQFPLSRLAAPYEWSINMVRKVLEATLIAGTLLLAACNTVSGAGKDVSSAGKAVSNAAEDSK